MADLDHLDKLAVVVEIPLLASPPATHLAELKDRLGCDLLVRVEGSPGFEFRVTRWMIAEDIAVGLRSPDPEAVCWPPAYSLPLEVLPATVPFEVDQKVSAHRMIMEGDDRELAVPLTVGEVWELMTRLTNGMLIPGDPKEPVLAGAYEKLERAYNEATRSGGGRDG